MVFRIKKLPDIWVAELMQAPSQPVMKIALVLNTTDSATVLLFQLLDVEPVGVAQFWRERIDAGKAFNLFFHFVWRGGAAVEKRLTAERIAAIEAPSGVRAAAKFLVTCGLRFRGLAVLNYGLDGPAFLASSRLGFHRAHVGVVPGIATTFGLNLECLPSLAGC